MRVSSTSAGDAGGGSSSGFRPFLEVAAEPKALLQVRFFRDTWSHVGSVTNQW
jgi:hypothetical protein